MDDKIIETLSKLLDEKLKPVLASQERIESNQAHIEKKLDSVVEQTADLTEFRTEMNDKLDEIRDDLNNVEVITASNWKDIAKLKAVK